MKELKSGARKLRVSQVTNINILTYTNVCHFKNKIDFLLNKA